MKDEEKSEMAYRFYEAFLGKEKKFISYVQEKVVNGISDNYSKSWREIKEDVRSLERHTNLHIYFKDNPYE